MKLSVKPSWRFVRLAIGATLVLVSTSVSALEAPGASKPPQVSTNSSPKLEIGLALFDPAVNAALGRPPRLSSAFTGAFGLNHDYERGQRAQPLFYQQRIGGRWVQMGIARNNPELRKDGWKALKWGFDLQRPDGSFDDNPGSVLGIAAMLDVSGTSLLAERQLGLKSEGEDLVGKLTKSAQYIASLDPRTQRGIRAYARYVHRYWVTAAALGLVAELTNDESLRLKAAWYARAGFARQTPDGVNPEGGGYDVAYHAVGLISGAHYYTVCPDPNVCEMVKTMIAKGATWLTSFVREDGSIDTGKSTRMMVESTRRGGIKHLPPLQVASALAWSALVTGNEEFRKAAQRIVAAEREGGTGARGNRQLEGVDGP